MSSGSDGDDYWGQYGDDACSSATAPLGVDCWSGCPEGAYLPDDHVDPVLHIFRALPVKDPHASVGPCTGLASQQDLWGRHTTCSTAASAGDLAWGLEGTKFAARPIDESCLSSTPVGRPSALWSRRSQRRGSDRELAVNTKALRAAGPVAVLVSNDYWQGPEAPRKLVARKEAGGPRRHRPWDGFDAGVTATICGLEATVAALPSDPATTACPPASPVHSDGGGSTPAGYWANEAWDPDEKVYVGAASGAAAVNIYEYMDWDA